VDGVGNPLFPLIPNTPISAGSADKNIQPYSFRPSIQLISNGGKPFARPTSYDRSKYALIANFLTAKQKTHLTDSVTLYTILGNKYNCNDKGLAMSNQSASWPDATPTQRKVVYDAHKNFFQGLLYFLASDVTVPAAVRSSTALYGLSGDEFVTTNNWPPQMHIREGRRMFGDFVLTQTNIPAGSRVSNPICMASYVLDCHAPAVYLGDRTHYIADGSFFDTSVEPFQLPMECIVPPIGGVTNLLVPVCISASHIAYAPIRMEPSFCMMGEAAGRALKRLRPFAACNPGAFAAYLRRRDDRRCVAENQRCDSLRRLHRQ
jgi:hypothetical protein